MGHAYLLVEAEDKANTKEEVKSSEEIQNYFTNIRTTLFNIYKNSTEVPPTTSYRSFINDSNWAENTFDNLVYFFLGHLSFLDLRGIG